jgi:FixJ family two-component response regulator
MTPKKISIAIIDDDLGIRDALKRLLSSYGYRTELYASAENFINAVLLTEASCLVVDVQLGDISGVELGRHLVATGLDLPIIFITASRDETIRRQALEFGCFAFLYKPFSEEQLIEAITRATYGIRGLD